MISTAKDQMRDALRSPWSERQKSCDSTDAIRWYAGWNNTSFASGYDLSRNLDNKNLVRCYDSFNDVCLLAQRLDRSRNVKLIEVGCATGEFYRYLRLRYPNVIYHGIDISEPAIRRARDKYPKGRFFVNRPDVDVSETLRELQLSETYEVAYASDVVLHQTRPFEFISELLSVASEMVIFKCRTRDVGQTEIDPEQSCQYQARCGTWVPYIVLNLDELIAHIRSEAVESEIVVYRNHMVLGGGNNRYLPKDCYLKETGTAVAAVGVFLDTDHPGRVSVENRQDGRWSFTLGYRVRHLIYRSRKALGLAS